MEMDTCADCGYAETSYTAAKAVIADYFGVVDGQPHTVTVSDLSEAGVTTAIRYGHSADACTLTSAPNYTEAGDYPVYYEITYTYHDTDMVEDGVAYVHPDRRRTAPAAVAAGTRTATARTRIVMGVAAIRTVSITLFCSDTVAPSCMALGYDRLMCTECGKMVKANYKDSWATPIRA
ncbi:MAG: hypothetical protein ACLTYN_15080 [Dysosmobacter welbionis]